MMIDCHTHIWQRPQDLGLAVDDTGQPLRKLAGDVSDHMEAVQSTDLAMVWGFASRHLKTAVPIEFLGQHVGLRGSRMVGIVGLDPTDPAWRDQLAEAVDQWSFRGVTICPAAQDMHPLDNRALALYEACVARNLPLLIDLPGEWQQSATLNFARPDLLDGVGRDFPKLRVLVSGFGYPYIDETLTLLEKFPLFYTDTAHLGGRPLVLWPALARAHEARVLDKVLFGSGFPFVWPRQAQATIFNLCSRQIAPPQYMLPRVAVEQLMQRDALAALGIPRPEGFVERAAPDEEETVESENRTRGS